MTTAELKEFCQDIQAQEAREAADLEVEHAALNHFCNLARRGKHGGCSGGEADAAKLAVAIVEHSVGLDAQAIAGAIYLLERASVSYHQARQLIE